MTAGSQVLAGWTRELVRELVPEAARPALLAELGVSGEDLWARDGRVAHQAMCALWERLTAEHADPLFGLGFARRAPISAIGVTGYLAMASQTGLEALERVVRYQKLIKGLARIDVQAGSEVELIDAPPADDEPWPRHLAESVIAAYLGFLQRWSTGAVRPRRARFQHLTPAAAEEVRRALGCPVQFGAADNALVLDRTELEAPLTTHDPELGAYLEQLAGQMVAELPEGDAFLSSVRRAIAQALPSGDARIEPVARRLAMGPRTLQRRLQAMGLSYQALVHQVRHEASERLLRDPRLNVTEVAFLLGFSDPSGFRRARRRWTGEAPRRAAPRGPVCRDRP